MHTADEEPLLTAKQLAQKVALHPRTLTRFANELPGFPAIQIGRCWRFELSRVKAYLREHPAPR